MNKKEKYLIIGADDFGICPNANQAIKELYESGYISSVNIIAGASCTADAIEYAIEHNMPTGVHLTLNSDCKEHPWHAISGVSSITDQQGYLYSDTNLFAKYAKSKDVSAECKAQIDFLVDKGVCVDHIDNHCGTMYGINGRLFFVNAFSLCREYNLPFRFPKRGDFLQYYFEKSVPFYVKIAFNMVVATGRIMGVKLIDNMISNPYPIKEIASCKALGDFYIDCLRNLPYGVSEMFLHPAYYSKIFSPLTKEWQKREWEAEFLASGRLQSVIKDEGVKVISYRERYACTEAIQKNAR